MRKELILVTIAALALITGCGGEKTVKEPPPAASSQEGASAEGVEQGGVESGGAQTGTTQQQQLLAQRIIYFDFDTADIRPEFTDLIAAHARNLASNQRLKVRL